MLYFLNIRLFFDFYHQEIFAESLFSLEKISPEPWVSARFEAPEDRGEG